MRLTRWSTIALAPLVFFSAACNIDITGLGDDDPTNLTYTVLTGGSSGLPAGILLTWDAPLSRRTTSFAVYGRPTGSGSWYLIGTTTSTSFHDAGEPQLQYYVSARDANDDEFGRSRVLTIDGGSRLPAPTGLASTPVVNGVQLRWNSNAATYGGTTFGNYRVYSARYDSATRSCASAGWTMEGTTITEQFLVGALTPGLYRCFAVSAVTREGVESGWSEAVVDAAR